MKMSCMNEVLARGNLKQGNSGVSPGASEYTRWPRRTQACTTVPTGIHCSTVLPCPRARTSPCPLHTPCPQPPEDLTAARKALCSSTCVPRKSPRSQTVTVLLIRNHCVLTLLGPEPAFVNVPNCFYTWGGVWEGSHNRIFNIVGWL